MYIIKNAIANLRRNTGRNLLLSIILFMVIFLTALSIILHSASKLMIQDYTQRFGSEVTIQNTKVNNTEKPSVSALLSFGTSKYLQSRQYLAKTGYIPKGLTPVDDDGTASSFKGFLLGSSRKEISDDFQKGLRKITEGSMYTRLNECIVSKKFATLNNLKPGDSLTLQGKNHKQDTTLTISGIYDDVSMNADSSVYQTALTNRNNEIYASFETVMETSLFQNAGSLDIRMYLKKPEMLRAFQKELKEKGLPDGYAVTTDVEGYERVIAPVEHLADISKIMMMGVLSLGAFLMILLSIMTMKERTYEIGVLRAIGMKKNKVICGLLCEIMMITGICLILGLGSAQLSAAPFANLLMASTHTIEDTETISTITAAQASLQVTSIAEISLLSLGLAMLASCGGILFTIRYEPMKILSEKK